MRPTSAPDGRAAQHPNPRHPSEVRVRVGGKNTDLELLHRHRRRERAEQDDAL